MLSLLQNHVIENHQFHALIHERESTVEVTIKQTGVKRKLNGFPAMVFISMVKNYPEDFQWACESAISKAA